MNESQAKTQEPSQKHGPALLILLSIFLAVYFLFPMIFLYPLYFCATHRASVPANVLKGTRVFFYPVSKIAQASPAYQRMILWEAHLLGMNFDMGPR